MADGRDVLSEFLRHTSADEFDAAYALLATSTQKELSLAQFKVEASGSNVYHDFDKLNTSSWKVSGFGTSRRTISYSGKVTYTDGPRGTISAFLEKEEGSWRIASVNIQRGR
jgi:hypothetical protein